MTQASTNISLECSLRINSKKINLTNIGGEGTITLDGKNVTRGRQVYFSGYQTTKDGDSRIDVNKGLTIAMEMAWKENEMSLKLKRWHGKKMR